MTSAQEALVERLQDALAEEPTLRVVAMFGGRSFMVDERILVSAQKSGDLLVRAPADRHDELIARPGASRATMGEARRPMGRGWITVGADAIADDAELSWWLDVARQRAAD